MPTRSGSRTSRWLPPISPRASVPGSHPTSITHPFADPFHVVRLANLCVDQVRCRVQNETLGHRGRKHDPLYRIWKLLLTGAERLDEHGHDRVLLGPRVGDPHDEVLGAWLAKESVRDVYLTDTLKTGACCSTRRSAVASPMTCPRSRHLVAPSRLAGRDPRSPRDRREQRTDGSHRGPLTWANPLWAPSPHPGATDSHERGPLQGAQRTPTGHGRGAAVGAPSSSCPRLWDAVLGSVTPARLHVVHRAGSRTPSEILDSCTTEATSSIEHIPSVFGDEPVVRVIVVGEQYDCVG